MADAVKIDELEEIHTLQATDKFVVESASAHGTKAIPYHDLLSTGNVGNGMGMTIEPRHKYFTTTLETTQWEGQSSPYTCTISIPVLTATQMVYVSGGNNLTQDQIDCFASCCITGQSQAKGSFTLKAMRKPTVALPIIIELGGEVQTSEL